VVEPDGAEGGGERHFFLQMAFMVVSSTVSLLVWWKNIQLTTEVGQAVSPSPKMSPALLPG